MNQKQSKSINPSLVSMREKEREREVEGNKVRERKFSVNEYTNFVKKRQVELK